MCSSPVTMTRRASTQAAGSPARRERRGDDAAAEDLARRGDGVEPARRDLLSTPSAPTSRSSSSNSWLMNVSTSRRSGVCPITPRDVEMPGAQRPQRVRRRCAGAPSPASAGRLQQRVGGTRRARTRRRPGRASPGFPARSPPAWRRGRSPINRRWRPDRPPTSRRIHDDHVRSGSSGHALRGAGASGRPADRRERAACGGAARRRPRAAGRRR